MHHVFTKVSDMGQVWGWGYGGEGQLGLGSRIKMVPTPHLIPCLEHAASGKDRPLLVRQGSVNSSGKVGGSYVKEIACGGRHSAVVTGQHLMADFLVTKMLEIILNLKNNFTGLVCYGHELCYST